MNSVESGELSAEDAADTFEAMNGELDDKINDYCRVIQSMEADLETINNEISRLTRLKTEKQNQIKGVKSSLRFGLDSVEKTKFDTGIFKGYFRKGAESLNILNQDLIPSDYIFTEVNYKADKKAIKEAIKNGESVEGVEVTTGEPSLIIK